MLPSAKVFLYRILRRYLFLYKLCIIMLAFNIILLDICLTEGSRAIVIIEYLYSGEYICGSRVMNKISHGLLQNRVSMSLFV